MRSRSLWRESPKTSICIFCSNIDTPFRHQSIRRHAHFGALAKSNDLPKSSNTSSQSGFGAPAFGATKSNPNFPDKPTFGQPPIENNNVDLTPEEKRVKDALAQKAEAARQKASARGNPSSRFDLFRRNQPAGRKDTTNTAFGRNSIFSGIEEDGFPPRGDKRSGSDLSSRESGSKSMVWGQLKKKGHVPPETDTRQPRNPDRFQDGRAERQAQASSGRFTPLRPVIPGQQSNISASDSQQKQERPREEQSQGPLPIRRFVPRNDNREPFAASRSEGREPFAGARNQESTRSTPFAASRIFVPTPSESSPTESNNDRRPSTNTIREPSNPPRSTPPKSSSSPAELTFEQRQQLYEKAEIQRPSAKAKAKVYEVPKKKNLYDEPQRGKGKDAARGGRDQFKARRRERDEYEYDEEDDGEAAAAAAIRAEERKRKKKEKAAKKAAALTPIFLPEYISVGNLASAVKVKPERLAEKMLQLGFEHANVEHILNGEDAGLIAQEYGFEPIVERVSDDLVARPPPEDVSILPPRPPVVTIMGHVDHGKTTLLDYLRKSSVAATEHGGITQHIGAFSVSMPSGKIITFLDTPGHAVFLNMRQRGANVTDIVVLVVAADDSVKPQTIEAISHAKAARVPIVVAINKIDKPDANSERVKQDLARHGVDVEDFGGEVQAVEVSGKTGQGMEELEETVTTLSEVLDMRADIDGPAEGWVLEASIKSMGKVATVLVRRGTMRPGDVIVAGTTWARIRVLRNEAGVEIESATPGTPVEIDGWKDQPTAGDEVLQAPTEQIAKSVIDHRLEKVERDRLAEDMEAVNDHRKQVETSRAEEKRKSALDEEAREAEEAADRAGKIEGLKEAYFIIKADVSGSVEAVVDSISAIGNKEVVPNILRAGVGQLTEFDVEHAAIARGTLINFNTTVDPNIAGLAEKAKVAILDHNVIYRLVDDVKLKMSEYLAPSITQRVLGEAEVADIFNITIKGRQQKAIAGVKVRNGTVNRNSTVRVLRNGVKIFDGAISSLKNLKKDVVEMRRGTECGMGFEKWTDFQVGDQVQTYETKIEKRYLE